MALAAGKLRHRVTLEEQVTTTNEFGETEVSWVGFAQVWAAIEPLSAREYIQAEAMQSNVSARITLRWRPELKASMRIVHKDTIYNPAGILADPVSGQEYATIPVSTGVNQG
jgi:SPP1 family predicted phage head-tail adaptor